MPRPQFHVSNFRQIVHGLLLCPGSTRLVLKAKKKKEEAGIKSMLDGKLDPEVRDLFYENWLSEYDDIRWFFLREAA